VLVVDDDPDVRRSIAKVLSASGLAVVTAENGIAAKAAIGLHEFVAIVCDIRMELLSGLELFDELKAQHPDLAQRLVFVTAWNNDPEIRPVVEKPFDIQDLVALVRHVAEDRPSVPGSTLRFSLEEARQIRERSLAPGGRPACPCCSGELALSGPTNAGATLGLVWEVRCRTCRRTLTVSGVPESSILPPEPNPGA